MYIQCSSPPSSAGGTYSSSSRSITSSSSPDTVVPSSSFTPSPSSICPCSSGTPPPSSPPPSVPWSLGSEGSVWEGGLAPYRIWGEGQAVLKSYTCLQSTTATQCTYKHMTLRSSSPNHHQPLTTHLTSYWTFHTYLTSPSSHHPPPTSLFPSASSYLPPPTSFLLPPSSHLPPHSPSLSPFTTYCRDQCLDLRHILVELPYLFIFPQAVGIQLRLQ